MDILTQNQFFNYMKEYFVANQDKITDLNVGSGIYTQFMAFARQLNQVMVKCSGGFKTQFEQIPYKVFDFERESETYASGTVVFSAQTAPDEDITISAGTIVSTESGLLYTTQDEVYILSGATDSGAANITANEAGSDYNQLVGTVTVIKSSLTGVNSVTNNSAITGGTDEETNTTWFQRFKNYILGLQGGNSYSILTAASQVDTIQSANVENHFPPEDDLYNFTVYVDDGSGSVPDSVLEEVDLELRGDDTSDYPGYVCAGINFRVLSASQYAIEVDYTATIDPIETDSSTAESDIEEAIQNYIDNLWIGEDVIRAELYRYIMSVTGVTDLSALTLNSTTANIETGDSQVARTSTITGTIET
ncbi:MAG: baseplate J/gp47 family protein [Spirochaetales bacterium]|nr:baseplate J/gp47 family protein [Spirochaetales bacterium]